LNLIHLIENVEWVWLKNKNNLSSFSVEQQTVLSKILQRPLLPKTLATPGGFFLFIMPIQELMPLAMM